MFPWRDAPAPAVRALLERERSIPIVPPAVRARAVARASAALAAPPVAERATASAPPHTIRWATAAGLVLLAAAGGGAAAYELGARLQPLVAPAPPQPPWRPVADPIDRRAPLRPAAPLRPVEPPMPPRPRAPSPEGADPARAELHLLERARAAVAREDFAGALLPLAEHARRFKTGRLAEEREALRVTALAELGRGDESRRAIAAFEARFPRSPLLAAVRQMAATAP